MLRFCSRSLQLTKLSAAEADLRCDTVDQGSYEVDTSGWKRRGERESYILSGRVVAWQPITRLEVEFPTGRFKDGRLTKNKSGRHSWRC